MIKVIFYGRGSYVLFSGDPRTYVYSLGGLREFKTFYDAQDFLRRKLYIPKNTIYQKLDERTFQ